MTMKRILVPVAALALLGTAACSNMDNTQQRVISGGAIGTGVGVVGTVLTGGCVWCGAVIGGAVGAGAGYIYDQTEKSHGN
jgi:osmotically inducible lipoprotein OsmB